MDENNIEHVTTEKQEAVTQKLYDWKVWTNFGLALIFIWTGMHKLYVYTNDEDGDNVQNAYVGGDAYNFIINAGYATAYFVLALIFVVLACTFLICNHLKKGRGTE